jgi:hypothetical protein
MLAVPTTSLADLQWYCCLNTIYLVNIMKLGRKLILNGICLSIEIVSLCMGFEEMFSLTDIQYPKQLKSNHQDVFHHHAVCNRNTHVSFRNVVCVCSIRRDDGKNPGECG